MSNEMTLIAVEQVEKKLVDAKREAKAYEERGLPVPDHVRRKIENLKGAAMALRKDNREQQ